MVRLRVKQTVNDLTAVFEAMFDRTDSDGTQKSEGGLLEGADDEIDQLFGD